jgi:hypothetical protein
MGIARHGTTKLSFFFDNKILPFFPCHGCENDYLFVVNAIITFTFIGATINPTYKDNCWGTNGQYLTPKENLTRIFLSRPTGRIWWND